jgi:Nucleoside 2-deoxyribosyltransferase
VFLRYNIKYRHAPVAQLDRAMGFYPTGRGFESLRVHHICGRSTTVSIQVFQTWDESSILSARTKLSKVFMKIFLCVPFSSRVDAEGRVFNSYRKHIEALTTAIKELGHDYFVALEYTGWMMGGSTSPEDELKYDLSQIDESDVIIALLEERVSAGVQLENGYAFAKGKKVYVYQIGKPAWSNIAFSKIAGHAIVQVENESEFVESAAELIKNL